MLPKIIFEKPRAKDNVIHFGEALSQFEGLGLSTEELDYLQKQFAKKEQLVVFNRLDFLIIIAIAKEEKTHPLFIEGIRSLAKRTLSKASAHQVSSVAISYKGDKNENFLAFLEGALLGSYRFDKYIKKDEEKVTIEEILIDSEKSKKDEINKLIYLCNAVHMARDLVNEPVNHLNATKLAQKIKAMALEAGAGVEIFEKKKIESLRMGGLLAVNKGSIDPPTFSIVEWKPEKHINKKPVVLIGKGLVYDTGGLSLKPTANSMDEMKCDMAGGAGVACAIYAIAMNKLPVHVIALIPSTDNRPGGNAYTPGDIITMHNGSTVEVLNTDAEGRLILADAISYASLFDPEVVITMATLTGSAQMAIGQDALVGMGNADEKLMKQMIASGNDSHERVVEFPFWDEYAEELKSDVADMKNIGGRMAGAITAGKFLEKFTEYPFIHLDIAGPAFLKKSISYRPKGGTGIGVRLLYRFVERMVEK